MKRFVFFLTTFFLYACSNNDAPVVKNIEPSLNERDSLVVMDLYGKYKPGEKPIFSKYSRFSDVTVELDPINNEYRVVKLYLLSYENREFPEQIKELTKLRELVIEAPFFYGNIPYWIGSMEKLEVFNIIYTPLDGEIPSSIGNLSNLKELLISHSKINGYIPNQIGNLKQLKRLFISECNLRGVIPDALKHLDSLQVLEISNTKIEGAIPNWITKFPKIRSINMNYNQLSGTFPIDALYGIGENLELSFQFNKISELSFDVWNDSIPYRIPMIGHNNLSGKIPEWVKSQERWKKYSSLVVKQNEGFGFY